MDPIIIVGTGRCGSSALAKAAQLYGIDMGGPGTFRPECPDGDWEDPAIKAINNGRIHAAKVPGYTQQDNLNAIDDWKNALLFYASNRVFQTWGFKHPASYIFILEFAKMWPDATFVWCQRDLEDTAQSFHKNYGRDIESCRTTVNKRHRQITGMMNSIKCAYFEINMTEHKSDKELRDFWDKVYKSHMLA